MGRKRSAYNFIIHKIENNRGNIAKGRPTLPDSFLKVNHKLFTTPQLHLLLSGEHRPPKPNEYLLCFIAFLLRILCRDEDGHAESDYDDDNQHEESDDDDLQRGEKSDDCEEHKTDELDTEEQRRYIILRKELDFLFTILGDAPFQKLSTILFFPLIETLAVDIGSLIYSCLFEKLTPTLFDEKRDAMLKKMDLLKVNIEECHIKLSESPIYVSSSRTNPIDSQCIVDSLIEDLEDLLNLGFDFTSDTSVDLIKKLQQELMFSRSLLMDPRVQDSEIDELKDSLLEIRDIAYEAEYLVISFVAGNLPVWYLNLRLYHVISKMNLTKTRFQDIITVNVKSKTIISFSEEALFQHVIAPVTPTLLADNVVVGFDENRAQILNDLVGGPGSLTIISLIGMPGLGKTTAAITLYEDPRIHYHFDCRAWCVVSQKYDKRKVLIEILKSLSTIPSNDEIWGRDETLGLEIHKSLFKRRYFIVIDDVWQSSTLDDLRLYFPDDRNGSRILLTSRIRDVVPSGGIIHSLPLLSEIQSWELLKNKVFNAEPCPPQLFEVGKEIASHCGGLPLSIVVTAGFLRNVEKEVNAWETFRKQLVGYEYDFIKIMKHSYKNLPNHLKICFLYLGVFPEDSEIHVRNLKQMWISEGFIRKTENKTQDDLAEEYLVDLVHRSLLVISKRRFDGEIKTCIFHDMLRDMCIKRAEKENFMKCINGDDLSDLDESKRVYGSSTSRVPRYLGQHFRTFIGNVSEPSRILQMTLLRVVQTLQMKDANSTPKDIEFPCNLRYLCHDRMPDFTKQNFTNLEFLSIEDSDTVFEISPELFKMAKLRYLRVKEFGKLSDDCDSSHTNKLEYLSTIQINDKDAKPLKCSPHLRRIKLRCCEPLITDFSFFCQLESLTITSIRYFNELRLPLTIKKLHLVGLGLAWEKMSIIGGLLPNLYVLKLEHNAFTGDEWDSIEGEFQVLRVLKLGDLDLKWWNAGEEHFPQLERLVLKGCWGLEEIPDFGWHFTLQKIEMYDCNEYINGRAASIKEKQHDMGNSDFECVIERGHRLLN